MRISKNKKDIIITKKKATELFLILSQAKVELYGRTKTLANNYHKEFMEILELDPNKIKPFMEENK